jgi:transposase
VMERLILSDAAWERMAPLIIGRPDQKGSTGRDNRMFVEGVLWIVRTGSPWRDLPEAFGDWNSVFRRFSRWSIKGVWWRIFEAMSDDPDFEYLIVHSTIIRAHQHAAGNKRGCSVYWLSDWPIGRRLAVGRKSNIGSFAAYTPRTAAAKSAMREQINIAFLSQGPFLLKDR